MIEGSKVQHRLTDFPGADLPAGDVSKALMYNVAHLYGDDAANWPVTATFADANPGGKIDITATIDDQQTIFRHSERNGNRLHTYHPGQATGRYSH
ncbi:MAG TPA: hypothetical protein VHD63_11660 [Ktedonobacteraceae bacterium]|jgi:hypothetical protein|nr:hypothetical protein [Ktedonobacteraceae bacterium]